MTGRCPFVHAVEEGRYDDARAMAREGPEPAEEVVIDQLVLWAIQSNLGLPIPFTMEAHGA